MPKLSPKTDEQPTYLSVDVSKAGALEQLARFPALESLYLHGGTVTSLEPLRKLEKLSSLTLYSGRVPALDVLADLPRLERLDLGGCSGGDLSPLTKLPSLNSLSLPKAVKELDFLEQLRLEDLRIGKGYEKLAKLDVRVKSLYLTSATLSDLSPISHLTSLESLKVGSRRSNVSNLKPLAGLVRLKALDLPAAKVEDLSPLSKLKALESLRLLSNKKLSDVRPLAGLTGLTRLDLNLTAVKDLTPLAGLTKLESLKLRGTKVESLQPLLGLKTLKHLFLEKSRLKSIEGISTLAQLELLWIWGTKVRDLSPLAGLGHLQDLNIADLGSPQGTEAVGTLSALQTLDVYQTDFDPEILRGLKLERVRGCQYPLPDAVGLGDRPPAPGTRELGPGTVLDGRILGIAVPTTVSDLALSRDGSRVAVAFQEAGRPVRVLSTLDASEQQSVPIDPDQRASGVAFSADGSLYVVTRSDIDSHACQLLKVIDGGTQVVEKFRMKYAPRLVAHPRRPWLAATGSGARVWDLESRQVLHTFEAVADLYQATVGAFAAEPSWLFVHGTEPGKVVAYDLPSGEPRGRWDAAYQSGEILTVSADGRVFTSMGGNCYGAVVIDTRAGQRLYENVCKTGWHGGAFVVSPDGTLLVECYFELRGYRLPPSDIVHKAAPVPATGAFTPNNACVSADGGMLAFSTFNYREGDFRVFWAPMAVLSE